MTETRSTDMGRRAAPVAETTRVVVDGMTLGHGERAVDADAVLPSDRIGRYVIAGVLGKGGMGIVYEAHDPLLARNVAIKLLRAGRSAADVAARQRLIREAQSIAQLAHPNVVEVYEIGKHGADVFIAMELIEGTSLRRWLECDRTRDEILAALDEAGRGLAAAHRAGIVHRDFKPDNVMISPDPRGTHAFGRVRVLDFGLARPGTPTDSNDGADVYPVADDHLTRTGTTMGTPAYMAPEQFVGGDVDGRTDQFAFCIVAVEALSGRRPFAGKSLDELALRTTRTQIDPLAWRGVPRGVAGVLRRGLESRREDRWPDMDTLLAALGRRRVRRVVVVSAIGVAAAAVAVGTLDGSRCRDVRGDLWDDAARDRVRTAILATEVAHAAATWDRVQPQLDDHVERWTAAAVAACHADESAAARTCLDQRRLEIVAAIDALAGTDRTTVQYAERVAPGLPTIDLCGPDARADAGAASPMLADAQARLASASALAALGRHAAALAELDSAPSLDGARDPDGIGAQLHALRGELARSAGNGLAAAAAFEQAYFAALDVGRDDLAALAASELAAEGAVGYRDRWQWSAHAKAELARSGTHDTAFAYDRAMCTLQRDSGALDAAVEFCARALAASGREGATPHERILALRAFADLHTAADELGLARDLYEEALATSAGAWGAEHPAVADALDELGHAELRLGRRDDARRLGERALALREAVDDPDALGLTRTWALLASVALGEGDHVQARDGFERVLALRRRHLGESHPDVAQSWHFVALAQEKVGERTVALASMAKAAAIEEQLHPLDIARIPTLRELARMAYEFGAGPTAGREHLERAWAIVERSGVPLTHPLVKDLDHGYGETLLALGEPDAAVPYLERFVADPRPSKILPHVQFVLARALWKSSRDRDRAIAIVQTAAASWAVPTTGMQRDQLVEMKAWLAGSAAARDAWDEGMTWRSLEP